MPIYEYKRTDGEIIEVTQKITEEELKVCPETGLEVERILSTSTFHLKGSCWSKDNYSGKTKKKK